MERHMPVQAPDRDWDAIAAAAALAIRLMNTVGAERQRLAASGLDGDDVAAILTHGAVLALAKVYHDTSFHDVEGMITSLRAQLREQNRMDTH
jgi:hypothetical protein